MTDAYRQSLVGDIAAAFILLTRLPVPWGMVSDEAPDLGSSLWAYPVVGLVIGSLGGLIFWIASLLGLPALTASIVALATIILATGAFHEDGLADVADGLGGGHTRERKLEIMRDSRIGTYGALALILSFGLRSASLAAMSVPQAVAALITAAAVSRMMIVPALSLMPSARTDSLATQTGKPGRARLISALALAIIIAVFAVGYMPALVALGASALCAIAFGLIARRQVGGYTGDILGAIQQVSEVGVLIALTGLWSSS